ncbi:MAG: DUF1214 domain-containing protein, partial [Propionibacteriaceae bacterium]|nr:DUF1214 domain-containing protein [Propionibacteriaceae bacterium]
MTTLSVLGWIAGSGIVQGIIIGAFLAFLTTTVVLGAVTRRLTTTVNGWRAVPACGQPGNGLFVRAACAKALPVVNVFEEAAYWTTTRDGSGQTLDGGRAYVMRFPAGALPPADAFWSLTITDVVGYMVAGPLNRSSFDDRSDLARNPDGAVDIFFSRQAPPG